MYHHKQIKVAAIEVTTTEFRTSQLTVIIPAPASKIVHGWHLKERQKTRLSMSVNEC